MTVRSSRPLVADQAAERVHARSHIVGAVLKAIRKRQQVNPGLTRSAAAERLGVSRQQMSRWLNNSGNWTLDTIGDLIYAFDLKIDEVRVVLEEDVTVRNYANPLSQQARSDATEVRDDMTAAAQ